MRYSSSMYNITNAKSVGSEIDAEQLAPLNELAQPALSNGPFESTIQQQPTEETYHFCVVNSE